MASTSISSFLLLLLLLLLCSVLVQSSGTANAAETVRIDRARVAAIEVALSAKGYNAMSLTLETTIEAFIGSSRHNNATAAITIFAPPDAAFFSSKYAQPPLTLLQYHIVPQKLDREALDPSSSSSSKPLRSGSKIETLLPGHPLVATTRAPRASINEVEIADWDLYNDGAVIVHGVKDFFDPAFQTLLYPSYDGAVTGPGGESVVVKEEDSGEEISKKTLVRLVTACGIIGLVVMWASLFCCERDHRYLKLISELNTHY